MPVAFCRAIRYKATGMIRKLLFLAPVLCLGAADQAPKLRGGNILAAETYSYRDLIKAKKLLPTPLRAPHRANCKQK